MDQLCHCERGRVVTIRSCKDTRNGLGGLAAECCPEILSSVLSLSESSFEMPVVSSEMTELCPLKLSPCAPHQNPAAVAQTLGMENHADGDV